jgi:hypothetical protein
MASDKLDSQQTALRRKIIGAVLAAALAAVLIAIVAVRSSGEKLLNENGDTLVLVGKKTDEQMTASTGGKLTDVGGCLGLTGESTPAIIIWPHGTTVATPDPLRVTVDDETYKLGDSVKLSGGYTDPLDSASYFYDRVPETCRTAAVFVASAG